LVPEKPAPPSRHGRVVLRREKAQRGGKTVVVVYDFEPQITAAQIEQLAREARQACGCGGTVREREIELQGDNPPKVRAFFESAGFRVAGV
jgi:translation initiation factor 1